MLLPSAVHIHFKTYPTILIKSGSKVPLNIFLIIYMCLFAHFVVVAVVNIFKMENYIGGIPITLQRCVF